MSQLVGSFNFMKKVLFLLFLLFLTCPIFVLAEQIDINTATLSQLDELTGIGPKYAQAIIDARPFSSVDDLAKVKGIGEKTLEKIKSQGLACVDCSTVIPAEAGIQSQNSENAQNTLDSPFQGNDNVVTPAVYPDGIFINEIMPSPEGPDEDNEWIELYNSNNFEVNLSGWKIQDSIGTQTTYIIKQKISGFEFLVLTRPKTKITLNNSEDKLLVFSPDGKMVDSASYQKAPTNQSYNRVNSGWQWSLQPTPGTKNVVNSGPNGLSKDKESDKIKLAEAGLANLSQTNSIKNQVSNKTNPWFLFFTALAITIISASAVLFIKFKLNQKNERT